MRDPAAGLADLVRTVSAPVLEKDHLLACIDRALDSSFEIRRNDHFLLADLRRFLDIDELYRRHLHATESLHQFYKSVFLLLCIVITFHARRGAAQQHFGLEERGIIYSRIACIVAWRRFLLFEAG